MQARLVVSRFRTAGAATRHASLAVHAALLLALALVVGAAAAEQPNGTDDAAGNDDGEDDQGADTAQENPPDLVACVPNSPWCKTFYFGVQFLPDYDDEDGTFDGLGEQGFFAHFNFDLLRTNEFADHAGFDIRFLRSGAVEEEEAGDGGPVRVDRFDTVAGTADLSGYYTWGFGRWELNYPPLGKEENAPDSGSALGLKLVAGARTREGALRNEDTLTAYAALGVHYRYFERFPSTTRAGQAVSEIQNYTPSGEFDIGVGHYEQWGGQRQALTAEDLRVIFRGVYNLRGIYYVGVYANGGRGPDEISVFFGARKSIVDLLRFLGLG